MNARPGGMLRSWTDGRREKDVDTRMLHMMHTIYGVTMWMHAHLQWN